jgi:hypothetical protein
MRNTSWFKKRSFQIIPGLVGLTLVLFTFQAATPFTPRNAGDQGGLDPRIVKIMNSSPYRHGEWGLLEVDPATGRIVHSLDPVQRFFNPGSTAKIFSVSGHFIHWDLTIALRHQSSPLDRRTVEV